MQPIRSSSFSTRLVNGRGGRVNLNESTAGVNLNGWLPRKEGLASCQPRCEDQKEDAQKEPGDSIEAPHLERQGSTSDKESLGVEVGVGLGEFVREVAAEIAVLPVREAEGVAVEIVEDSSDDGEVPVLEGGGVASAELVFVERGLGLQRHWVCLLAAVIRRAW